MPLSRRFDPAAGRVVVEIRGSFEAGATLRVLEEVLADPRWKPGFDLLIEYQEVQPSSGTPTVVRESSQRAVDLASLLEGSRLALVAGQDAMFGLNRMFQAYADESPLTISVFRERAAAEQWLARRGS